MKTLVALFVSAVVMLAISARAQDSSAKVPLFKNATIEQTEKSLIQALVSSSPGMQLSAAQTVRELKALYPERSFSRFVIPLMAIIKNDNGEASTRVVAAIALHELNSAMGDFAIEREAMYTNCARVKHICGWLAYYQWLEHHPDYRARSAELANYPSPLVMK